MATLLIHDYADELRLEITGKLSGDSVASISERWMSALPGSYHRKLTVDIGGLTGYDQAGRRLLRDMYEQGMTFSGGTPQTLVFLSEISKPLKPALVQARETEAATPAIPAKKEQPKLYRVKASGSNKG